MVRSGKARQARLGTVWRAGQGKARHGSARHGAAGHGWCGCTQRRRAAYGPLSLINDEPAKFNGRRSVAAGYPMFPFFGVSIVNDEIEAAFVVQERLRRKVK